MRLRLFALVLLVVTIAAVGRAQAPRPIAPGNTVLIASYVCAPDQFSRVDAIIAEAVAPILNKHVASGKLITWGYLATTLGGPTNRHIYIWASDPIALMQARQLYLPEIMASPRFAEYAKSCGSAVVTLNNLVTLAAPAK